MPKVYIYVVARDFGFAPNPFHGYCTLATCKPDIRRVANVNDWVIGMGGTRLNATGKCIFAMKISQKITFNEYWNNPIFNDKKPIRNGSRKIIVGDNIYHESQGVWQQIDSHHSHPDGTPNQHNVRNDTKSNAVLLSDNFYYLGSHAAHIPDEILVKMGYKNGRKHRVFKLENAQELILFLEDNFRQNYLYSNPYDFKIAGARYSAETDKVTID
ncbi:hypothetical protein [Methylotenera sp. 1P/1]|uniref:Nmad2 family putative nucleotide modification protein n=1 Tax=Methylotenera sp. 1P/1 TaxID=1131551 RepID=UPI00036EC97B|nr:hypothetical protein [Methylotenera sp. 1P/1]